jgi:glycosyltransferase involved in cell wall biosynthesis
VAMQVSESPLVTVVVCVYNAGAYLRRSLESALAQTYRNLEILVVNDGSTDGCLDSIRDLIDPRVRILHQANQGKPVALNRALDEARGDYYAVHDADDISAPSRIETQLEWLLKHADLAGVFCGNNLVLDDRHMAPLFQAKDRAACKSDIDQFRMPAHDPTGMYRLALVRDVRYEPALPVVEGYDYILRVGERWPLMVVGECLYSYRIHRESVTRRDPVRRSKLVHEVFCRAFQRRGLDVAALGTWEANWTRMPNREQDNNLAAHFMESVCGLRGAGRWLEAVQTGWRCCRLHPLDLYYQKALAYSLMPQWAMRRVRRTARGHDPSAAAAAGQWSWGHA